MAFITFEEKQINIDNINYVGEIITKDCKCMYMPCFDTGKCFCCFKVFMTDGTKLTYGGIPYDVSIQESAISDLNDRRNTLIALLQ